MIRNLLYIAFVLTFFQVNSFTQLPALFIEDTQLYPSDHASTFSMAIADLNGDFRDDIIHIDNDSIYFIIQLNDGARYEQWSALPVDFDVLSCNIADLNNDGFAEVIISGNRTGVYVFSYDNTNRTFYNSDFVDVDHYAQGSSVSDINEDGWLDFFATNDTGPNLILLNDGAGKLTQSDFDDFDVLLDAQSSGNYNAIWFDLDLDGDLDLYVTKCHINANSFDDPRRINQFFLNTGDSFIEMGEAFNLNQGDQSWCSAAGDFDNDGDVDLFLINHGTASVVLENNFPQAFKSHTLFIGNDPYVGSDQQVILEDFNNDGLLDAAVFGFDDIMFLNQGDFNFDTNRFFTGNTNAFSGVSGDFNNDGWMDLYTSFGAAGSAVSDKLYLNLPITNNWLKLSLTAAEQNRQAIGSRVTVFSDTLMLSRWVQSGESYGVTRSMNLHFGLSDLITIDSLICYWPSGKCDKYYNLQSNQHYVLTESVCIEELLKVEASADSFDCDNQNILLHGPGDSDIEWNTGEVTDSLVIYEGGYFQARSTGPCYNPSAIIHIDDGIRIDTPEVFGVGEALLCEGLVYKLYSSNMLPLQWNNGTNAPILELDSDGVFYAVAETECGLIESAELIVNRHDLQLKDTIVYVQQKGDYVIHSGLDNAYWYNTNDQFLSEGPRYLLQNLVSDTALYFRGILKNETPVSRFASQDNLGKSILPNDTISLLNHFVVSEDLFLHSFDCIAEQPGLRKLIVLNASNQNEIITEIEAELKLGINTIIIDTLLRKGDYLIYFDTLVNQQTFNVVSPRLKAVDLDLSLPLSLSPVLTFVDDGLLEEDYLYFFNWLARPYFDDCLTERAEYAIDLDTTVSNLNATSLDFMVYPNPVFENVHIVNSRSETYAFQIFSATSEILKRGTIQQGDNSIHFGDLPAGVYVLRITGANGHFETLLIRP